MKGELKARLIGLIQQDADPLARAWEQRLNHQGLGETLWVCDGRANPGFLLVRDLLGVLGGDPLRPLRWPTMGELQEVDESGFWQNGLCHGLEIFLRGEECVHAWAMEKMEATDREKVELFEIISGAFHQLFQFYARKYCESCRGAQAHPRSVGANP